MTVRNVELLLAIIALVAFHVLTLRDPLTGALQGFLIGMSAGLALGFAIDRVIIRPGVDWYLRRHGAT